MNILTGDWLMNAGITGYLRIQQLADKKLPDLKKGYIEIDKLDLATFTDQYFTAVLMRVSRNMFRTSNETLAGLKVDDKDFWKIRSDFTELEEVAFGQIRPDYKNFDLSLKMVVKSLQDHKKTILDLCDKIISKRPTLEPKKASKVKRAIEDQVSESIDRLTDKNLNFVYVYLNNFYRNKNIIANPAASKLGRKQAFQEQYVQPAIACLEPASTEPDDGFLCRFCKRNRVKPESFDDVNSLFAEGMFSTTGITISYKNFFYNMQPDLFVCDICELLLICAWAGFTEIPWRFRDNINDTQYIFVNLPSLKLLWDENEKIEKLYKQSEEELQGTIYQDIIQDVFTKDRQVKARWSISNILFIEIKTTPRKDSERPNFRYFHIGEDVANLFLDDYAIKSLSYITGKTNLGNGLEVNLRRNVVMRIMDHDSLFPLCYSLIASHLNSGNAYSLRNVFNISLISCIRAHINTKAKNGESPMLESKQIYGILKSIQNEGGSFATLDYDVRKRKSYILLSMARNGKTEEFYDVLMKIYMSQNKPVPESLIGLLNSEDEVGFRAKAYAFLSGFLGGKSDEQQE
jgi:CRISPR-associated protein Cas8b1/Cst1 subtype I-B